MGSLRDIRRQECFSTQFYKTKLCTYWQRGKCVRGDLCRFAHGVEELHRAPDLKGTALCPQKLRTGRCDAPNCQYAHDASSLRATDMFYKTSMCQFYQYGVCRLGASCRHAHGLAELRVTFAAPDQQDAVSAAPSTQMIPQVTPDLPLSLGSSPAGAEDRPPEELVTLGVVERCPSLPADAVVEEEEEAFEPGRAWTRSFSAPAGATGPTAAFASSRGADVVPARRVLTPLPPPPPSPTASVRGASWDGASEFPVSMGLLMASADGTHPGATSSVLQQMLENAMPDHYED